MELDIVETRHVQYEEYLADLKLKLMTPPHLAFDPDQTIESFINFALANSSNPMRAFSRPTISASSSDPLFLDKALVLNLFEVRQTDFGFDLGDDVSPLWIARYLVQAVSSGAISLSDFFDKVMKLNSMLGRILTPVACAIRPQRHDASTLESFLLSHALAASKRIASGAPTRLARSTYTTGHPFYWDQVRNDLSDQRRGNLNSDETEFVYCVSILQHMAPKSLLALAVSCGTPELLVALHQRLPVRDVIGKFLNPATEMLWSFFGWAIVSDVKDQYGRWLQDANQWRSATQGPSQHEFFKLLDGKANVDQIALDLGTLYLDALKASAPPFAEALSLRFSDELLQCMHRPHSYERDTRSFRSHWCANLGAFLSRSIGSPSLVIATDNFVLQKGTLFIEAAALLADVAITTQADALTDLLRTQLTNRLCWWLRPGVGENPHFNSDDRNAQDGLLRSIGLLILTDDNRAHQLIDAVEAALLAPGLSTDVQLAVSCLFVARILALYLGAHGESTWRQKALSTLSKITSLIDPAQYFWTSGAGLDAVLVAAGVDIKTPATAGTSHLPALSNVTLAKRAFIRGEYEDVLQMLRPQLQQWGIAAIARQDEAEAAYFWIVSLLQTSLPTDADLQIAYRIYGLNRGLMLVNAGEESRATLGASLALRCGKVDEAIKFSDDAIKTHPGSIDLWMNKVILLIKAGRHIEAFRLCTDIPQLYRANDRVAHLVVAAALGSIRALPEFIIDGCRQMLSKNDLDDDARYHQAAAYALAGFTEDAVELARQIVKRMPDEPLSAALLAEISDDSFNRFKGALACRLPLRFPQLLEGQYRGVGLRSVEVGSESPAAAAGVIGQIKTPYHAVTRDEIVASIDRCIKFAAQEKARAIFLPELSIPNDFLETLAALSKEANLYIFGGADYLETDGGVVNRVVAVTPSGVFDGTKKICPSRQYDRKDLIPGDEIVVFKGTPVGNVAALVCFDIYHSGLLGQLSAEDIDLLFITSINPDVRRLSTFVESDAGRLTIPVVVCNGAGVGRSFYGVAGAASKSKFQSCSTRTPLEQFLKIDIPSPQAIRERRPFRPHRTPGDKDFGKSKARTPFPTVFQILAKQAKHWLDDKVRQVLDH